MQTFNLDLSKKGVIPLLYAKQRDVGTKICIELTDNKQEFNIPENTQFSVWFTGKSGSGNYTEIDGRSAFDIDGNKVTVELIYQMLNNPGEHVMCLVMNDAGGKQQGLWNIPYFVEDIPGADSQAAVQYYQAFLQAQAKAEEAAERAEAAANSAENTNVIVSLEEGNVASLTATEIFECVQQRKLVMFFDGRNFIPLESADSQCAIFSMSTAASVFGIQRYTVDVNGKIGHYVFHGSDLVDEAVRRTEEIVADLQENIPEYWKTELQEGVEAINSALEGAGRNKSAFLWYTDAHWGYSSEISPELLKYLQEYTAMNKVNFGGDIANDYKYNAELTDEEWMALMRQWRLEVRDLPNHHSVVGNHDGDGTVAHLADRNHLYGFLMAPEETPNIVRGGDFYYYIDEPGERTRYLYLNTSFCTSLSASGEDAQGQFVVDALGTTPDGWHIIVISHIWFLYSSTSTPTQGDIPNYCKALLNLFDCYNSRTSGSITIGTENITFDYTNGGASVAFCIGGHTHVDHDFTSDGGIPVILTETDSFHTRGDNTATSGTSTEAAVYAIVADYENHNIHVICVGRGLTREVQITNDDSVQDYTNVLDEVGYTENMYVSASSGYVEKTKEGVDLTGYIPVNTGDIIRLKNVTMPSEDAYTNKVYFYDSTKAGANGFSVRETAGIDLGVVYDGGNLVQFTIRQKDIADDSGYIRIGAANIDSTSVITVNEEIG